MNGGVQACAFTYCAVYKTKIPWHVLEIPFTQVMSSILFPLGLGLKAQLAVDATYKTHPEWMLALTVCVRAAFRSLSFPSFSALGKNIGESLCHLLRKYSRRFCFSLYSYSFWFAFAISPPCLNGPHEFSLASTRKKLAPAPRASFHGTIQMVIVARFCTAIMATLVRVNVLVNWVFQPLVPFAANLNLAFNAPLN
jgi:hypothetical protein